MWLNFPFKNLCMFGRMHFLYKRKRLINILIIKVTIKNLYCCFCTKTQYSFIHDYKGVGEEVSLWLLWLHHTKQKNIHNSAKTYILLKQQRFESLQSGFAISEKKKFFVLGAAHGDPFFAPVWSKNDNFQRFQQIFFQNYWIPIKILIEFPDIFH